MSMSHTHGQRRPAARQPAPPARHPALPALKRAIDMHRRGTIRFFDAQRGFGFISSEGNPDTFLHVSIVSKYGINEHMLEAGVPVRFTSKPGRRNEEVDAIALAL
jgi:CspA family cold shock protein